MVVLYDKHNVLMNVTRYDSRFTKDPFHWYDNRAVEDNFNLLFKAEILKAEDKVVN